MTLIVIMGSGETAPTMVKQHRAVLARSGVPQAGPAVMLDTTFAFQTNRDDLVARTRQYFAESVGTDVQPLTWPRRDLPARDRETTLAALATARWIFAGPGSPSYALRHWRDTDLPAALLDAAHRGGTLVFGSAAACTVGQAAIPVYEIYKAGHDPRWDDGLDLLGRLTGIAAAVVPHYDNAEGGRYDTRYCYLGEERLTRMEAMLPEPVGVLGIDEHTALLLDLDAGTATVGGNGTVSLRRRGVTHHLGPGEQVALGWLGEVLAGRVDPAAGPSTAATTPDGEWSASETGAPTAPAGADERAPATSLAAETAAAQRDFDAALAQRDVDGCVHAVLDLEAAIVAWSTDSLQSDETDRARRMLRSMIVRLGELARSGTADPADVVGPFVTTLLALRERARAGRDYALADEIRDGLTAAGLEVRDAADGTTWSIPDRYCH